MHVPTLSALPASRETLSVFEGYHAGCRIRPGEFAAMENMSSDHYPLLATRKKRGVYRHPANAQGLIAKTACAGWTAPNSW